MTGATALATARPRRCVTRMQSVWLIRGRSGVHGRPRRTAAVARSATCGRRLNLLQLQLRHERLRSQPPQAPTPAGSPSSSPNRGRVQPHSRSRHLLPQVHPQLLCLCPRHCGPRVAAAVLQSRLLCLPLHSVTIITIITSTVTQTQCLVTRPPVRLTGGPFIQASCTAFWTTTTPSTISEGTSVTGAARATHACENSSSRGSISSLISRRMRITTTAASAALQTDDSWSCTSAAAASARQ